MKECNLPRSVSNRLQAVPSNMFAVAGQRIRQVSIKFRITARQAGWIRHRQPMGDRQLRTVACDVTQRRGAHCSLLGGHWGADTVRFFGCG